MDTPERNSNDSPPEGPEGTPPRSTPPGSPGAPPPPSTPPGSPEAPPPSTPPGSIGAPPPPADPYAGTEPVGTAAKADLGKRIVAALIDGIIASVLTWLPFIGWLLGLAYMTLRDGLEIDFMDRRSLGKKLMKLRPVRVDGGVMDIETSVRRNWMLALGYLAGIPFVGWLMIPVVFIGFVIVLVEFVLVMTDPAGRRWGDKFANTHVIEVPE